MVGKIERAQMNQLHHHAFTPWTCTDTSRIVSDESHWQEPLKWQREAAEAGERRRVLVGCDVFEEWGALPLHNDSGELMIQSYCGDLWDSFCELTYGSWRDFNDKQAYKSLELSDVRNRLFSLIDSTPNLDWILPTMWPENVRKMMPTRCHRCDGDPRCEECRGMGVHRVNAVITAIVNSQATADERVPALLKCRDLTPVLAVWVREPVETIDLFNAMKWQSDYYCISCGKWFDSPGKLDHCPNCGHEHDDEICPECGESEMEMTCPECGIDGGNGGLNHVDCCDRAIESRHGLGFDWLIISGGEKPLHPGWIRSLLAQAQAADVPFWFDGCDGNVSIESNGR